VDLTFPSGVGARASDFESWFFVAPPVTASSLTISPNSYDLSLVLEGTPQPVPVATLTLSYPAPINIVVSLLAIQPAGIPAGASVPPTVTVPKGSASVTFVVTPENTQLLTAEPFQIVASIGNALGQTSSVSATVNITGWKINLL
jgi:hypothetical protein